MFPWASQQRVGAGTPAHIRSPHHATHSKRQPGPPFLQAMEKNPELKKLAAKGITAKYLTRRCKKEAPGWRISPLREKKAFTGPQKKTRLAYALDALKRPLNYWLSTIFVDEHTFYRRPTALPAIHMAGQRQEGQ